MMMNIEQTKKQIEKMHLNGFSEEDIALAVLKPIWDVKHFLKTMGYIAQPAPGFVDVSNMSDRQIKHLGH